MCFLATPFSFLLKSSLFISLCALAFVLSGNKILAGSWNGSSFYPLLAVGCATFLIYNLTLFLEELQQPTAGRQGVKSWLQRHAGLMYPLLLLAAVLLGWAMLQLPLRALLFLLHLALLSILYTIPDRFARSRFRSLRSIPLFKIFLIAYVWAAMGAVLPYFVLASVQLQQSLQLFLAQFLFILAITLPFDIRDYVRDKKRGLLTIPGLLGIAATRWLSVGLLAGHVLLMAIWFSATVMAAGVLLLVGMPLLLGADPEKPYWYYTGLLDGLILLQAVSLIVLHL
jgi:4-hydroxybenzoate polyprenyltransferase